jgi:hypothetical protein
MPDASQSFDWCPVRFFVAAATPADFVAEVLLREMNAGNPTERSRPHALVEMTALWHGYPAYSRGSSDVTGGVEDSDNNLALIAKGIGVPDGVLAGLSRLSTGTLFYQDKCLIRQIIIW